MQLVDIILDNRISCSFIDDSGVENVIFCRPLEESLDNVSLIATKDNEFIHNYLEESTGKYLETSVILNDGTIYEGVRFKLVIIEEGKELPASTVNLSSLGVPSATDVLPPVRLIEEDYNTTLENIEEEDDFSILYDVPEAIDNSGIVKKVKALETKLVTEQQKLEQEKIKLNKERVILENERRLSKALEDYKAELLQETFLVSNHQKELLEKSIQDLSNSFQEQFDGQQINVEKYLDTLSSANLEEVKKYQDSQVDRIKDQINTLISERQEKNTLTTDKLLLERTSELESIFTEKLITELEDHKRNVKIEIDGINNALDNLIGEKLKENNDNVDQLLVSRAGVLQEQFNDKLTKDLIEHKDSLFNEFKTVSTETASTLFTEKTEELNSALTIVLNEHRQNLDNTVTGKLNEISSTVNTFKTEIDGKLPQLDETIKDINKRIQTLVIEKKNVQLLVDDAKKYTDTKVAQVSEEVMNYARRILDLGGGGGSNAVQYANGGTMNGSLNVTGQYLSGGIDISTLFGKGGGGTSTAQSIYVSGGAIGSIQPLSGNNTASGYFSNVAGGSGNNAFGAYSFIGGGCHNITVSNCCSCVDYASIISGENNIISSNSDNENFPGFANHSIIVGGKNNVMCASSSGFFGTGDVVYSNIAGGYGNVMCPIFGGESTSYSNIAGGCVNAMYGNASYSNIAGGCGNVMCVTSNSIYVAGGSAYYSNIAGGQGNIIHSDCAGINHSGIASGESNSLCAVTLGDSRFGQPIQYALIDHSDISGGQGNIITSCGCSAVKHVSIVGGANNAINGSASSGYCSGVIYSSSVGGGCSNTIFANASNYYNANVTDSNIEGGRSNTISGNYGSSVYHSNIAGGQSNTISACYDLGIVDHSNIAGGQSNTISACYGCVYNSGIASGQGNVICGNNDQGGIVVNHSNIAGGQSNTISSCYGLVDHSGIAGGSSNSIISYCASTLLHTSILGGQGNIITSCGCGCSTVTHVSIVGGHNNTICSNTGSAYYFSSVVTANIAGGCNNKIISSGGGSIGNSNIAGGCNNTVSGVGSPTYRGGGAVGNSNIAGGINNTVSAGYYASVGNSNIAGGCNNTVSAYGNSVDSSGIASGLHNTISSFYAFIYNSGIASGKNNTICACGNIGNYNFNHGICSSNIAGGEGNSICSYCYNEVRYASIAGGSNNTITGSGSYSNPGCCTFHSSIAGGYNNLICSASCSFIGGGDTNCTTSVLAVVVGGNHNCATGGTSFVGGGRVNTSSAQYSTVVGGNQNCSTGYAAFVGGGYNNNASGEYSSIIGGASNDTNSQANTFILGSNITALSPNYTFVNNLSSQGILAGACIALSQTPTTFINPVTASGTFLIVNINGTNKALQLWDYSS